MKRAKRRTKENKINLKNIIIGLILILAIYGLIQLVTKNTKIYDVEKIEDYKYFVLKQKGQYGVIDAKGNIIIESKYTDVVIPNPSKDIFVCKENGKSKVFNSKNKELYSKYENVDAIELKNIASDLMYEKSILKFQKDGKYGLVDLNGKEILAANYTSIEALPNREGSLLIKKGDKCGVANMKGAEIIKCEYDKVTIDNYYTETDKYKYSGYIVGNKTQDGYRYGYISCKGKKLLNNEYNEITRITEIKDNDNVYLISAKNGQYGLTKNGKEITSNEYQSMTYESDVNLIIVEKNQKYGAIDTEGKEVLSIKYDEINVNGLYMYAKDSLGTIVLDSTGKEVNINSNSYKYSTDNEKYFITILNSEDEGKYGVVDKNGNKIIEEKYSYIGYLFGDYFIASNKDKKLGIIDSNENIKVDFKYNSIQKIQNKNIVQATINDTGITEIYDNDLVKSVEIEKASVQKYDNYVKVYNQDEIKYLDNNGKELTNSQIFTNNKLVVKIENNAYGFADKNGNAKVECIYDNATEFNKYGFAGVKENDKWGVIDENGNVVLEPYYYLNQIDPDFIGKYYKVTYGFGECYYTDDV